MRISNIIYHPDFKSCLEPWCDAINKGEEPPQVELLNVHGVWSVADPTWLPEMRALNPTWIPTMRYRFVNATSESKK